MSSGLHLDAQVSICIGGKEEYHRKECELPLKTLFVTSVYIFGTKNKVCLLDWSKLLGTRYTCDIMYVVTFLLGGLSIIGVNDGHKKIC